MRFSIALCLLGFSAAVAAADNVYRWVDKQGVVHYGAQPPSKDAKPATLPEIQTYSHRSENKALPVSPAEASIKPLAGVKEVKILSPVQDEVFRDPQAGINVSVAVLPTLPSGAGVIFYLDGTAKSAKPSPVTSTSFGAVERGEHTVTAAVIDVTGKELMRAPPVTFHAKPPSAR